MTPSLQTRSEPDLAEGYEALFRVSVAIGTRRDPNELFRAVTSELHQVAQFTPQVAFNRSGNVLASHADRPSVNLAFTGKKIIGSPIDWYDANEYLLPVAGTLGNLGGDVAQGPGMARFDLSVFKPTHISERVGLQFRVVGFNIFNTVNFGLPLTSTFRGTNFNPSAGVITATATASWQIQFGMKLMF